MKNKPYAATVGPWLKANLGAHALGCLTGQSSRALQAAVQLIGLYSYCDGESEAAVLRAFHDVVSTMHGFERELAYHAIAHVLDWGDRDRIWLAAGLEPITNPARCAFE